MARYKKMFIVTQRPSKDLSVSDCIKILWTDGSCVILEMKPFICKSATHKADMNGVRPYTCNESVFSLSLCSSDERSTSLYSSAASTNSSVTGKGNRVDR